MSDIVLATSSAAYEQRVRKALAGEVPGTLRRWYDEIMLTNPARAVKELAADGAEVIGIGPGVDVQLALDLARAFDADHPDPDAARLADSVETALRLGEGVMLAAPADEGAFDEQRYSERYSCAYDGTTIDELEPRSFSFNSPHGACETCSGLGSRSGRPSTDSSRSTARMTRVSPISPRPTAACSPSAPPSIPRPVAASARSESSGRAFRFFQEFVSGCRALHDVGPTVCIAGAATDGCVSPAYC